LIPQKLFIGVYKRVSQALGGCFLGLLVSYLAVVMVTI
jgi:hypothetical protein